MKPKHTYLVMVSEVGPSIAVPGQDGPGQQNIRLVELEHFTLIVGPATPVPREGEEVSYQSEFCKNTLWRVFKIQHVPRESLINIVLVPPHPDADVGLTEAGEKRIEDMKSEVEARRMVEEAKEEH
jgi:hypothetical protein